VSIVNIIHISNKYYIVSIKLKELSPIVFYNEEFLLITNNSLTVTSLDETHSYETHSYPLKVEIMVGGKEKNAKQ
jgi:hypothetical protein